MEGLLYIELDGEIILLSELLLLLELDTETN